MTGIGRADRAPTWLVWRGPRRSRLIKADDTGQKQRAVTRVPQLGQSIGECAQSLFKADSLFMLGPYCARTLRVSMWLVLLLLSQRYGTHCWHPHSKQQRRRFSIVLCCGVCLQGGFAPRLATGIDVRQSPLPPKAQGRGPV